jgi:hypothetical protein
LENYDRHQLGSKGSSKGCGVMIQKDIFPSPDLYAPCDVEDRKRMCGVAAVNNVERNLIRS